MRVYGGEQLYAFLVSALDRGERSASRTGHFTAEASDPVSIGEGLLSWVTNRGGSVPNRGKNSVKGLYI
jgi:hypothetical protein